MTPSRIQQLVEDGYVFTSRGRINLTEKGLQVLSAYALRPMSRSPKVTKTMLAEELRRAPIVRMIAYAKTS